MGWGKIMRHDSLRSDQGKQGKAGTRRTIGQAHAVPASRLMRIYIAGHDIFRADAAIWAESVRDLLDRHGHQALIPLDGDEVTAHGIYHANIRMILSADGVLANLNPFRGDEPDSGTCFEVGFAIAWGLPVIGYLSDGRRQIDKVGAGEGERPLDANGLLVENFGLPLNLMLAIPCRIVVGDLRAAVAELSTLIT